MSETYEEFEPKVQAWWDSWVTVSREEDWLKNERQRTRRLAFMATAGHLQGTFAPASELVRAMGSHGFGKISNILDEMDRIGIDFLLTQYEVLFDLKDEGSAQMIFWYNEKLEDYLMRDDPAVSPLPVPEATEEVLKDLKRYYTKLDFNRIERELEKTGRSKYIKVEWIGDT